jgi:hypothetical protein
MVITHFTHIPPVNSIETQELETQDVQPRTGLTIGISMLDSGVRIQLMKLQNFCVPETGPGVGRRAL